MQTSDVESKCCPTWLCRQYRHKNSAVAQRMLPSCLTGTRLQACIIYIGQADVSDAVGYLRKINAALRSDRDRNPQHALPPGAGQNVVYDIVKLRLGLGLIRKKIVLNSSDHRVGVDGGNAVLNTVRDLQPEEITIPRQLWELAGTVQWFYPDHSRPLSEQLDQLSEFLWRNTTCHREEEDSSDDGVTGEQMQYARCTLTVLAK